MIHEYFFKMVIYSHYFKVSHLTPRGNGLMKSFCRQFVQYGMVRGARGRFTYEPVKVFAASNRDRTEFRFHINTLESFNRFLAENYVTESMYSLGKAPLYNPVKISAPLKEHIKLRDYQIPVKEYICANDFRHKLVELNTGRGKGISSLASLAEIGFRTVLIVKPAYIEKWVAEILAVLDVEPKDLITVQGSAHLKGLISMAKDGTLKSKFIIISNRTMANYIKEYELDYNGIEALGYECTPDEFYEVLGAGVRLIDEVHQDAYLNYKLDLYTNIDKVISLSATLLSNDEFLEKMYAIMYPKDKRFRETEVIKYIHSYALFYGFREGVQIRTSEFGSPTYSHHAFERSIMAKTKTLDDYLRMIKFTAQLGYFDTYQPGDKLIIFATSIKMCTIITDYLKECYPDKDIRRYVEDDPYENIIDADIRVTTILSGGTAIDIPGLTCTILTTAVDSIVAQRQCLGRLRDIPNREVKFYTLVCEGVPKAMQYAMRRKDMLLERTKTYKELKYDRILG